jgi:hypothetical protein
MSKLLELVMIVKNSGEILRKCLKENKKYIDQWTIVDTGSTDNTCDIIKEELKDVPGNLYFSEFVDFSQARNKSLELSSGSCKYIIVLDDSYYIHGGIELRKILKNSNDRAFRIKIGKLNNKSVIDDYYSTRIIKTSENLRYVDRIHEYIYVYDATNITNKNIFLDDMVSESHKERSMERYKKDIELLKLDMIDGSNKPKTLYYLARTTYLLKKYNESLEYYKKLQELNEIHVEYIFVGYYEHACLNYHLTNDKIEFKKELLKIVMKPMFSHRAEPMFKLAVIFKDEGNIIKAEKFIDSIINFSKPEVYTIMESDIYQYSIPFLYVEIKLILKKYDQCIDKLKFLLENYPNNIELLNIKYQLCQRPDGTNINDISSIELSYNKTIVIHITSIVFFNPKTLLSEGEVSISGSEYMAIFLSKELVKLGYRIFIFGNFENKEKNINYECIYENIQYIDHKYINEFLLKYKVDHYIVLRIASNLLYYNNIKNVYLWVHDILFVSTNRSLYLQTHKEKFKKIISISEWQKHMILKELKLPENLIINTRNAINPNKFLKNIEKIPFRFIYISGANRGLNGLLYLIPKIKQKYPLTTLYLFVDKHLIDDKDLEIIEKTDYIFLEPRKSQDEIAVELMKSDVFLYPCTFKETYCISVVEAMASKCLIASTNLAALNEIISNRGITVNINKEIEEDTKDNLYLKFDELLKKLFFVMERKELKERYVNNAYIWAINQSYSSLAKEWIENILI